MLLAERCCWHKGVVDRRVALAERFVSRRVLLAKDLQAEDLLTESDVGVAGGKVSLTEGYTVGRGFAERSRRTVLTEKCH